MPNIGPTRCRSWHGHVNRTTTVSLAGEQLTFASGSPSQILVSDILEMRDEGAMRGGGGNKALLLRVKEGDVGIMMAPADHQIWLSELTARGVKSTPA